jgi:hypothetical protein
MKTTVRDFTPFNKENGTSMREMISPKRKANTRENKKNLKG